MLKGVFSRQFDEAQKWNSRTLRTALIDLFGTLDTSQQFLNTKQTN